MDEPSTEDEFGGKLQIRCDYETYLAFRAFADNYYTYDHAIRDLLRVADENPRLYRRTFDDLDMAESDGQERIRWG